jgi:pimeloyl-ACP methyl ester carboxylesterase
MSRPLEFARIDLDGRALSIEYQWVGDDDGSLPLIVFLHEGLGSLAMWKDFPERFCRAAGCRGLVYSRPGYGQSTPRAADEHWDVDFMHRQADGLLPALLEALQIDADDPPWLFGHSDGGSIALLYAAANPRRVAGLVVLSPHIMVEELSIESIEKARQAYLQTELTRRSRFGLLGLERYLAEAGVSRLVDRKRDRGHSLPAARGTGAGRRIRYARTGSRYRPTRRSCARRRTGRLRSFAAAGPAPAADRNRRPVYQRRDAGNEGGTGRFLCVIFNIMLHK